MPTSPQLRTSTPAHSQLKHSLPEVELTRTGCQKVFRTDFSVYSHYGQRFVRDVDLYALPGVVATEAMACDPDEPESSFTYE